MSKKKKNTTGFVDWFRQSSPYIHAHRGKVFVLSFGGEALADDGFADLIHDIALLNGLGIRLVLVPGARPQIEQQLATRGAKMQVVNGLRVTDDECPGLRQGSQWRGAGRDRGAVVHGAGEFAYGRGPDPGRLPAISSPPNRSA